MITDTLFDEVLIRPASQGADTLHVVSGYATGAMAFHHLRTLENQGHVVQVELIVGMCSQYGLSQSNHKGFQQVVDEHFQGRFQCSYRTADPPVHAKVYVWCSGDMPVCAFAGSANYTQTAFGPTQREAMTEADPALALGYFNNLIGDSVYCTSLDAENLVQIYNDEYYRRVRRTQRSLLEREMDVDHVTAAVPSNILGLPTVKISLLDKTGGVPARSGLNWGQRPEERREPNQAYIRLPASVYRTDFFPPVTVHFTVLTDDGKVLICTRAQANGKAIHTPHNNSLIGEYFRNRLGLANGQPVATADLINYGRTDVSFYKIDDETYYMDFSV